MINKIRKQIGIYFIIIFYSRFYCWISEETPEFIEEATGLLKVCEGWYIAGILLLISQSNNYICLSTIKFYKIRINHSEVAHINYRA